MRTREDPRWMKLTVEVITRAIYFAVGAAIAFYFVSFLWPRIGTFRVASGRALPLPLSSRESFRSAPSRNRVASRKSERKAACPSITG